MSLFNKHIAAVCPWYIFSHVYMLDLFPQHVATAHAYNMPLRVLAPLPGVAYSSRSPPPTLLGLLFRAVAQFSRDSIHTFNARLKIRDKKKAVNPVRANRFGKYATVTSKILCHFCWQSVVTDFIFFCSNRESTPTMDYLMEIWKHFRSCPICPIIVNNLTGVDCK